ncbi:MAG TPA: hypothetical protein VH916_02655 [Dehalococcoidia bacterium]|jgi:ribosomal protein L40E
MRGLLLTFLISFAGLAVLYVGPFLLLGIVVGVGGLYGRTWGLVALGAAFAFCAALMLGFSRIADQRTERLDLSSRAPRDLLFCQRCGAASTLGAIACNACGSMNFGLGPPAGALRPRSPGRAWRRLGRGVHLEA